MREKRPGVMSRVDRLHCGKLLDHFKSPELLFYVKCPLWMTGIK